MLAKPKIGTTDAAVGVEINSSLVNSTTTTASLNPNTMTVTMANQFVNNAFNGRVGVSKDMVNNCSGDPNTLSLLSSLSQTNNSSSSSGSQILAIAKKVNVFCLTGRDKECTPFIVDGYRVGLLPPNVMEQLRVDTETLLVCPLVIRDDKHVEFSASVEPTYEARSAAINMLLERWRDQKLFVALKGWRNECFDVSCHCDLQSVFKMERSATFLFGVRKYGVDINGFVCHPIHGICIWLQKRSSTKQTWPGVWDNMVGGGLSVGFTVNATAIKEAQEEASIPMEVLKNNLKPAGTVSYFFENERGLSPNTEFVFDLELPNDFKPVNNDGEVDEFNLVSAEEALRIACSNEFKTTSCPVILDFMIRKGLITEANEPNLLEIKKLLNVPLEEFYVRDESE